MIFSVKNDNNGFKPIDVTIKIQSIEELKEVLVRLNVANKYLIKIDDNVYNPPLEDGDWITELWVELNDIYNTYEN